MPLSMSHIARFFVARVLIAAMTIVSIAGIAQLSVADDDASSEASKLPKHFILNPDHGRPSSYPAEISIKQAETFLKTQKSSGQGCGGGKWEGEFCGMFGNFYASSNTPWLKEQVAFDATYAQTKTGTFLANLMLGHNKYARSDRNKDKLTWQKTYEPEYDGQEVPQVLYGDDSAKRKALLVKIKESFQGLDLTQFPAERRKKLESELKQCDDDQDPTVVSLAKELQEALR